MKKDKTEAETDAVKLPDDQLNEVVGGCNGSNGRSIFEEDEVHVENGISVDLYKNGRLL